MFAIWCLWQVKVKHLILLWLQSLPDFLVTLKISQQIVWKQQIATGFWDLKKQKKKKKKKKKLLCKILLYSLSCWIQTFAE